MTKEADCAIIMGTSLQVYPFAMCTDFVGKETIRVLINRETNESFKFGKPDNNTDLFIPGNSDDSIQNIVKLAGWEVIYIYIYRL